MADLHEKIEQTNNETRQRIHSLPDAALVDIQRNPDRHSQQEITFATQELEKRYPTPHVTARPKPAATYWMDSCVFWVTFLILGAVVGGFLGFGAGILWLSAQGWTEPWQPVSRPPDTPTNIVAISDRSVWIETEDGTFYYNEDVVSCESNCWQPINVVPGEPVPRPDALYYRPHACVWVPPFLNAKAIMDECNQGPWLDLSTAYALGTDGELYIWRYSSGGEWVLLDLVMDVFIGITLGIIVVIVLGRRRNPSATNQ